MSGPLDKTTTLNPKRVLMINAYLRNPITPYSADITLRKIQRAQLTVEIEFLFIVSDLSRF